jgi:hypothetical protein
LVTDLKILANLQTQYTLHPREVAQKLPAPWRLADTRAVIYLARQHLESLGVIITDLSQRLQGAQKLSGGQVTAQNKPAPLSLTLQRSAPAKAKIRQTAPTGKRQS